MKNRLLLLSIGLTLWACGRDPLLSPWMENDWKCSARDSNGNPYFGVGKDKNEAIEKARWQCVSGSPYKQSCTVEASTCEQLE